MTWYNDAGNQAAAEAAHTELVTFASLDFASGFLRVHSRLGTITFGGFDYLGVGKLGSISDIDEDAQLRPTGVTVTLSGVDAAVVSAAMNEDPHGRAIALYQGYLNLTTRALIADPEPTFKGLMDYLTCSLGEGVGTVTVQCEGELARWQRHSGSLYTHESQQSFFSGDRGFDQIPYIQNRKIDWSKSNVWQSQGGGSSGSPRGRDVLGRGPG